MKNWCIATIGALITIVLVVVDTSENRISDLEFELNQSKCEFYEVSKELDSVNRSIAEGLCLPRLDTVKNPF